MLVVKATFFSSFGLDQQSGPHSAPLKSPGHRDTRATDVPRAFSLVPPVMTEKLEGDIGRKNTSSSYLIDRCMLLSYKALMGLSSCPQMKDPSPVGTFPLLPAQTAGKGLQQAGNRWLNSEASR